MENILLQGPYVVSTDFICFYFFGEKYFLLHLEFLCLRTLYEPKKKKNLKNF